MPLGGRVIREHPAESRCKIKRLLNTYTAHIWQAEAGGNVTSLFVGILSKTKAMNKGKFQPDGGVR